MLNTMLQLYCWRLLSSAWDQIAAALQGATSNALEMLMRSSVPTEGSSDDGNLSTLGSTHTPLRGDRLRAAWR